MGDKPLYIFDLDGTLTDASHRKKHIDFSAETIDWTAFTDACGEDPPREHVCALLNHVARHAEIWLWTSRQERVKEITVQWLETHTDLRFGVNITTPQLMMRPDHLDGLNGMDLKKMWFDAMLSRDLARLVGVVDDDPFAVRKWIEWEVPVFYVGKFKEHWK